MKTGITLFGILATLTAVAVFVGCQRKHDDHAGHDHATHDHAAHQAAETVAQAGEQTICPVMKLPINKNIFVEYEDKKVYLCCPACIEEFNRDPKKYLPDLPQFQDGH